MGAITVTIKSTKNDVLSGYNVVSVDVIKEVNRIPHAEVVVRDGGIAVPGFPLSDAGYFNPGEEIEILLRNNDQSDGDISVFKGIVTKQNIKKRGTGTYITALLKDKAVALTKGRFSIIHKDTTDSKIIETLIAEVEGVSAGTIEATTLEHPVMPQYNCNHWDFILMRAEANGLLVSVDDSVLSAKPIDVSAKAKYTFEYGASSIESFEIEIDSESQFASTTSQSWVIADQAMSAATEATDITVSSGELVAKDSATAVGNASNQYINSLPLEKDELKSWVDGKVARDRLAFIRGSLVVPGIADLKPLDVIELAGMGLNYNGTALVSGIRHRVDTEKSWRTDIQLGLSNIPHHEKYDVAEAPASGLLPPAQGLHIGIVSEFEEDPAGELRVKVLLPGIGEAADGVWARLASPDAGNARGFFFRPEINDEVIVGFFNNDPRQAVVLGSLYSSAQPPHENWTSLSADNFLKGIATKSGNIIEINDEDGKTYISLMTPGGSYIVLDDEGKGIDISDPNGNSVLLNADGITLTSAADFIVKASGNVEISGSAIDLK